ncbi:Cyclic nucleotide-binding-like [Phytophthora cactorum]|nr:Cyclic nucleotide-binding-like [Phytophthora cactorum]
MTPIKVGFDVQSSGLNYALDVVVDVIYLIEMVLNFFTSYEDDATGRRSRNSIKSGGVIFKAGFLSMLLNQSIDTTWAPTHDIRNSDSLGQQYVDAFYFAIMVTTANDVNPITPIEKLFTSVMLFVGIVINASIIGSAANLLANLDKEEIARKNHMDSINDYLRFKKVPLGLQNKIRRYYDYALTTRLQDPTENLFVDLPDRLKLLLKLNLHSDFVRKVPLFRALSHSGVVAIIQCLVPIVACPERSLSCTVKSRKSFTLSRLVKCRSAFPGLMTAFLWGISVKVRSSERRSLLTGEPTTAEVKAERVCELMYLSKDNFETIVDRFPTFFLAVRRISESRLQTAQNIQKMSKMNRRPTQMLKIKKLSLRGVAQAAVLKARLGDHSKRTRPRLADRSELVQLWATE